MTTTTISSGSVRVETASTASYLQLAGRIGLAAIFILSGLSKIAATEATAGYIASVGLPAPQLALAVAIGVEVLGGIALILGYRTKFVAGVLAIFSVVTAIAFHFDLGDQNQFIHFFKNIAMAGGLAQLAAVGAGRISLDARG